MPSEQPIKVVPENGGISLAAIIHVFLRSKWLILTFSLAGLAAAVAIYLQTPKNYVSEAKVLIRYVVERRAVEPLSTGELVRSPDADGYNIINTEMEILSSLDQARKVAEMIGPEKILPLNSTNLGAAAAAVYINQNLKVANADRSSVIQISFEHRDPEMARSVLQRLIEAYLARHMEVHRGHGLLENHLMQQSDKHRAQLIRRDEELRTLRNKVGVFSVDDTRKGLIAQIFRSRQELLIAEVELAERSAIFKLMETNFASQPSTTNTVVRPEVPSAVVEEYRALKTKNGQLIEDADKQGAKMEEANPGLKSLQVQTTTEKTARMVDLAGESFLIVASQARIAVLKNNLEQTRTTLAAIEEVGPAIEHLQAERAKDEASLRGYQTALDRLMMETRGGGDAMSNIALVQAPSVASPVRSRPIKLAATALFAGIGGGIGLALLIGIRSLTRRTLPCAEKSEDP